MQENLFEKQDKNFKDQFIRLKVSFARFSFFLTVRNQCAIYFHATNRIGAIKYNVAYSLS